MFGSFAIILIHERDQNRASDTESIPCTTTFLAHLDVRPCELLPSLFVRRPFVNISHFNLLLRICNQTLVEWSLSDLLPKLCPVILPSNHDVHEAKNRNNGGWNFKKSSLKLLSQFQPNFAEMILGWSPSKNVTGGSAFRPRWSP